MTEDGQVLAQLMAQAEGGGSDLATLRGIVEEAGELGARRALSKLGLDDGAAPQDMAELRELLRAWREARRSVLKAVMAWLGKLGLTVGMAGLAVKLGFAEWMN